MTQAFVPSRRLAALSVAMTLFLAPIASAQSPEPAPPIAASQNTALLSQAAFARLIEPPQTDVTQTLTVKHLPHIELPRTLTAPTARRVPGAPTLTRAPQQQSWVARHKVATGILIGVGGLLGATLGYCALMSCAG